ncbi:MAG: S-methyl-5'-thioadenosine phosphorylase [Burkholderiaceae bacterium]|jgi:5'-methylthioadenosine phosphorylase|nr:S-methyl-5'-thioadenosine phosphorylase [Burkholderiaceae bacterium]
MQPTTPGVIGVIGGSGVYNIDGLTNSAWQTVHSSFGAPSDQLLVGELDGQRLVFLPRHGRGHRIPPSEVNYRANIDALKRCGVTDIISVSAVGSLREDLRPGMFVIVDQFVDRTFAREKTFFTSGCVAHVSMAHPTCDRLSVHLKAAADACAITAVKGGVYLVMEGPQFSSRAESELYRSWNCDVIGMTNMPEAKLAREAEICYASIAMVTDYDCWHPDHDAVTVDQIIRVLNANAGHARSLVKDAVPRLSRDAKRLSCSCQSALEFALITAPEARDPELLARLDAVAGRVLRRSAKE